MNEIENKKKVDTTHLIRIHRDIKIKLDALRTTGYASRPVKLTYNNTIGQLLNDSDNLTLLRLFLECTVTRYSWSDREHSLQSLRKEIDKQILKEQETKRKEKEALATLEDRYLKKKEAELVLKELDLLLKKKPSP